MDNVIKLECLLYYNYFNKITGKVKNLQGLLQNLHKIGRNEFSKIHYELDILNKNLKSLSSMQQMKKAIQLYMQLEDNLRLFNIDDILHIRENIDFESERIRVYEYLFRNVVEEVELSIPQVKTDISYVKIDDKKIDISAYNLPLYDLESPKPKKGGDIKISIKDLKIVAEEMDEIISRNSFLKRQSYRKRLESFKVSLNNQYGIEEVENITIKEVCHIIGMVGTGKSTLIQVLVFYLAKKGYRSMVLFETVKEVVDNTFLFEKLGIQAVAINGERNQQNRIQKVIEYDEMIVNEHYAQYLTGNCYISNLAEGVYDSLTNYGKEPCYNMKYNDQAILCPFFQSVQENKILESLIRHLLFLPM